MEFSAKLTCLSFAVLMIVGVKESATANKLFTVLNIAVLGFLIITGATKANFGNWNVHLPVKIFTKTMLVVVH